MAKHYYAAKHYYGIEFCNDYSTLFRFTTAAERDSFVDDCNWKEASAYGGYRTEAVTRAEAQCNFPKAFRLLECRDEADERDWIQGGTETSEYWSASNIYC